jgi:hypothetical protein
LIPRRRSGCNSTSRSRWVAQIILAASAPASDRSHTCLQKTSLHLSEMQRRSRRAVGQLPLISLHARRIRMAVAKGQDAGLTCGSVVRKRWIRVMRAGPEYGGRETLPQLNEKPHHHSGVFFGTGKKPKLQGVEAAQTLWKCCEDGFAVSHSGRGSTMVSVTTTSFAVSRTVSPSHIAVANYAGFYKS